MCVIEGIRMRLRAMDLNVCNRGNKNETESDGFKCV